MKSYKTAPLIIAFLFSVAVAFGQAEPTDFFRNTGKIYVVVAVLAAVLIGFLLCLAYMDRRIKKLEQQLEDE